MHGAFSAATDFLPCVKSSLRRPGQVTTAGQGRITQRFKLQRNFTKGFGWLNLQMQLALLQNLKVLHVELAKEVPIRRVSDASSGLCGAFSSAGTA